MIFTATNQPEKKGSRASESNNVITGSEDEKGE